MPFYGRRQNLRIGSVGIIEDGKGDAVNGKKRNFLGFGRVVKNAHHQYLRVCFPESNAGEQTGNALVGGMVGSMQHHVKAGSSDGIPHLCGRVEPGITGKAPLVAA